tara:strand:+ start:2271 stop:2864 length:594 start_codon:yes stop_codon:yes gene_type:complete
MNIFKNIKFFHYWYKNNFISPAPNFVKHKIIKFFLIKDSILIETGTNEGKTISKLAKYFDFCYSIEPSKFYFDLSNKNLKHIKNKIELINGTSETSLEAVLVKCKNKKVTFFLDGHYSGKDTYKGKLDTPIEYELNLISKYIKTFKDVVIIVDDFRCFELENYPTKHFLTNVAFENKLFFTIEHDMFIMSSIVKYKA